ncbi:MAG TPA: hypothetical protein VFS22_01670 [Flavisolibacter sp.]|nr:hypothetical protein [Flavisolibacter sp.]
MQTKLRLLTVLTLALFTTLTACKKDAVQQQEQNPELATHVEDQSRVSTEMDAADLDINYALEKNSSFSGRVMGDSICAATVTFDTLNSTKKITITYNGADCGGLKIRTGSILISMASGVHWKDVGAQINVAFQNFKVTRKADNKSITINGTHTLTNVEGGLMRDLLLGRSSITHTVASSNMSITFDDGTQRSWQVARKRVYTLANGGTITITGTHTEGNQNNIAEWGTDRFGNAFATAITQPLVISANCQFRLISGQVTHNRMASTASVTFGLDKEGNPASCPASGSFYYKLTWTGTGGNTLTYIAPY